VKSTPYPYILVLGQDDNERLMGEKLRESVIEVQWSTSCWLSKSTHRIALRHAETYRPIAGGNRLTAPVASVAPGSAC
jgi:hypothetical protein